MQHDTDFTVSKIQQYLRKFGEIQSIEILPKKESEACVTFVHDLNAYLALLQHEFNREARKQQPFFIRPANTWEQPQQQQQQQQNQEQNLSNDENPPEMFRLNEDCFLHLFKYLDRDSLVNLSEVCTLFHKLLKRYCFPTIHKFELNNIHDVITMPLSKMRRTLRCIGTHITDLKYKCDIYGDLNISCRFLEIMVLHIGQNLRRARFLDSHICYNDQISIIAPILRNLSSLEITDMNHDLDYDVDFEELCPDLIELKLNLNMRLIKCCKPWNRLRHLTITNNEFLNTITFISLIEQNTQLESLEFDVFDPDIRLRTIGNHLTMLQKLTLEAVHSNLGAWHFVHLNRLEHLSEINLLTLEYEHLRGIFDCLATFQGLRVISVHAYRPEYEEDEIDDEQDYERSLIDLAKQLPHLQHFAIRSIAITEKTLVHFIRYAIALQSLHVHWCHLTPSDALILNITSMLKLNRGEQPTELLKLYLNPGDLIGLRTKRNEDVQRYLQISAACKHFGFDDTE